MPSPVSVVIPNWNGRTHLGDCLASLSGLEAGSSTEIILVDNGSTDGSVEFVCKTFPGIRVIRNDANRGFAAACNQGALAAATPYVAFLNNDARVDPGWLRPLVETLEAEPDVAAAGSLVLDWKGSMVDFGRAGLTPLLRGAQLDYGWPVDEAPRHPAEQLFANGAAMLVRRKAFLEIGGFDERFFAYYEDVDLGWRYWILGWRVVLQPASRVFHRHHGTSHRLRGDQIDFLLARNALASALKNVDERIFAQLIPVILLGEGARLAAAIGPAARFHVSGFSPFAWRHPPDTSVGVRVLRGLGSEALRIYRRDMALRARVATKVARLIDPSSAVVSARAGSGAAALDEILWGWPDLMASRATIQAGRTRSDEELSRLFGLDAQRLHPRSDAVAPDETRAALFRAIESAGLGWLLPSG